MRGRTMIRGGAALALVGVGASASVAPVAAQQVGYEEGYGYEDTYAGQELEARLWFDRGDEPLLERGERVRIYYRTNADAYVAIFNIDTDGTVRLVYPSSPAEQHYVRGGRDYRLLFPRTQYWYVDDQPGMGYYFIVASPEPFDLSAIDYSYYERGWDLTRVGRTVYSDPYVAMDDYVATLIPDWQYVGYALDFSTYHVGSSRHDYPRFLCYDCHGFRSYNAWNPYHYACSTFRVVVYTDPWYYPSFRYRGTRVVYTRPPRPFTPRFDFKERAAGDPVGVQYVARPPVADRPGVAGDPVLRRSVGDAGSGAVDRGGAGSGAAGYRPAPDPAAGTGPGASRPGVPPTLARPGRGGAAGAGGIGGRPSDLLPGRGGPRGTGAVGTPPASVLPRTGIDIGRVVPRGSEGRPVLERRTRPGTGTAAGGTTGVTPPPTRTGPSGGGAGVTPPVRTSPPAAGTGRSGASTTPPGRSGPPATGVSGTPPGRSGPPTTGSTPPGRSGASGVGGTPPATGSGRSGATPPAGRSGGGGDDGPGSPSAPGGTQGSEVVIYRGGVRGGAVSRGSTVTRSGGVEIIRHRPAAQSPPSRPTAILGGARSGPGAVRGATPPAAGGTSQGSGSAAAGTPSRMIPGRGSASRGGAGAVIQRGGSPTSTRTAPTRVVPGRGVAGSSSSRGTAATRSRSTVRSGGTSAAGTARSPVRSSSPATTRSSPVVRRGSGVVRPPIRSSTPPARAGSGSARPPVRSSSPPARSGAAGAPPVRRSGSPPAATRPPARTSTSGRPPVGRPPVGRSGGGGG